MSSPSGKISSDEAQALLEQHASRAQDSDEQRVRRRMRLAVAGTFLFFLLGYLFLAARTYSFAQMRLELQRASERIKTNYQQSLEPTLQTSGAELRDWRTHVKSPETTSPETPYANPTP